MVLPVNNIMSPISSTKFLVGRNARSAALRTISAFPSSGDDRRLEELYDMRPRHATSTGIVARP